MGLTSLMWLLAFCRFVPFAVQSGFQTDTENKTSFVKTLADFVQVLERLEVA